MALRIIALIPAYKEEESIAATVEALLAQERVPDQIVVIPNGCKADGANDQTAEIARTYMNTGVPLTVFEFPQKLEHKKSEALNRAWNEFARDADLVICLDADTILPSNAVRDWEEEFLNPVSAITSKRRQKKAKATGVKLGGSSSKFTMRGGDFWTRLQRSEVAMWTDVGLKRGFTTVLAGTGCAISGQGLREVVDTTGRYGPWSYDSQVEDFELTYQLRKLGYVCWISPTVRAYTDSMKNLRALWGQRMKWQVGTVEDLLSLGVRRLTLVDWYQQFIGIMLALVRLTWVMMVVAQITLGIFQFHILWMLAVPGAFALGQLMLATRIPDADGMDYVYAIAIIPGEIFAWVRAGWFLKAWCEVLAAKLFKTTRKDRWQMQYAAEATH